MAPVEASPGELSLDELGQYIARLSYRPGWQFELVTRESDAAYLKVTIDFDCSGWLCSRRSLLRRRHRPHKTCGAFHWGIVYRSPDYVDYMIRELAAMIDHHERREWFRRDGVPIENPHDTIGALINAELRSKVPGSGERVSGNGCSPGSDPGQEPHHASPAEVHT